MPENWQRRRNMTTENWELRSDNWHFSRFRRGPKSSSPFLVPGYKSSPMGIKQERNMKLIRMIVAALFVLTTSAFAAPDAQQSFDQLKSLAGNWEAQVGGKLVDVSFKVMGNGSSLMSEITTHGEDMVSVFHMDKDRLLLTHYCGAGNQPRMVASPSPDGKTLTFDFVDGTNILPTQIGYMQRMVLTMSDADHHSERWILKTNDGKEMVENFELHRKQ